MCCLFDFHSANEAASDFDFIELENYGDSYSDEQGDVVHQLHTWDEGYRSLLMCKKCGALWLKQFSEYHGFEDDYYTNLFEVKSKTDAERYNREFNGYQLEQEFVGPTIHDSKAGWIWNKERFKT